MEKTIEKESALKIPRVGDIIEGKVISKGQSTLFLDLGNFKTGIIFGKEYRDSRYHLKNLKTGDILFVKIVDIENEDGYVELSVNQAGEEMAWDTLKNKKDNEESIIVTIQKVNKGGLLAEVSGIPAFLPVSQLSAEHYPRVEDGDAMKILKELQKFIGMDLEVRIFDIAPKEGKLILSEKAKETKKLKEVLKDYQVGDVVEGTITAVLDFGAFIKFKKENASAEAGEEDATNIEGLIHISELDWQLIEDPTDVVKVGDKVKAKIIDISNDRVSLSLKALKDDPWQNIEQKYQKGDTVKGTITKLNPFGAFVQLTEKDKNAPRIQGLMHISEIGTKSTMDEKFKVGKEYKFQILSLSPSEHKMSLKIAKEEEK